MLLAKLSPDGESRKHTTVAALPENGRIGQDGADSPTIGDSMKTETIEYKDGDVNLRGYLAFDEKKTGKRPGVLVMPEAFGLGEHAKKRAERLAELGYVAFAGDPYGNGIELANLPDAMKHAMPLFADPAKLRQRGRAALDFLASTPHTDASRLASIGFCMGGTFSLELARDGAPLKGIVR